MIMVIHCHTRRLCRVKCFNGVRLFSIFMNDYNEKIRMYLAGTEITLKDRITKPNYLDKLGKSLTKHAGKLSVQMLLAQRNFWFYDLVGIKTEQDVGLNKGKMGKLM